MMTSLNYNGHQLLILCFQLGNSFQMKFRLLLQLLNPAEQLFYWLVLHNDYIICQNIEFIKSNCAQIKFDLIVIQLQMSKNQTKTRKKKPNTNLTKNAQNDTDEDQRKIQSAHLRIFQANKIMKGQQLPSKFKFRESQLKEIESTIKSLMNSKKPNVCKMIMITGSPGAGKTLCANNVLHKLQGEDYKVIALNSNILKKKKDVQSILASQLLEIEKGDQQKLTTFKIMSELENSKVKKCILYVEEIELFFNSHTQALSEDFFDIFTNKNLKILLLGISNTIDALQKYGQKLNIKVSQVTNIVFHPYTIDQLKQIILDKISQVYKATGINIKFDESLVRFVCNKIDEAKKGDMRMVFDFMKSLCSRLLPQESKLDQIADELPVTIDIINKSFTNLNLQRNKLIANLPFQQQIILIAIYNYLQQTQDISITEEQLRGKLKIMYGNLGMDTKRQLKDQIEALHDYNMITTKVKMEGKSNPVKRYLLRIPLKDIKYSFEDHQILGKLVS